MNLFQISNADCFIEPSDAIHVVMCADIISERPKKTLIKMFLLLTKAITNILLIISRSKKLRIFSWLACVYRVMDARGKFGDHEKCVRVARGAAESNSSFLSALQTSQVRS